MHYSSRLLAAALVAIGVASCTENRTIDSPIPAGKRAAKIALTPEFSPAAKNISAALGDFGITFDHVRIALRNNPDTSVVVVDTTVAFGSTSSALTLDLTVPVDVDGQIFNALIQYIGPSGVVFSGTMLVQSHAPDQPAPEQPSLVLNFVGPGAKLKTITIAPKPIALLGTQTLPVTITAIDSSGATIAAPPIVFTTSDASVATLVKAGAAFNASSFGKRGQARIIATTPIGIADTVTANVTLPPAKIVLVSGGGQTGAAGSVLANRAVVQVNASDDVGVPGVTVTFAPPINGAVGNTTAVTDVNGQVSTTLTLAPTTGAQSFLATAATFNVAIPETSIPGAVSAPQSSISATSPILADNQTASVITVQAKDQYGNAVATGGATVVLSTTFGHFGPGTATTTTATDNKDGTYSASLYSALGGAATIGGTIDGTAITSTATTTFVAGTLDHFDVTDANGAALGPTIPAGTPFVVRITARDAGNAVIPSYKGASVIRVTNSAFLDDSVLTAPAAVAGVATQSVTLAQQGANVTLDVTGTLGSVTKTSHSAAFAVTIGGAARIAAIGEIGATAAYDFDAAPQTLPTVAVYDGAGNQVPGVKLTFTLPPLSGQTSVCGLNANSASTNSDGVVTLDGAIVQLPQSAQPYSCLVLVTATGPSGVPLAGSPLPIAFVGAPVSAFVSAWIGRVDNGWNGRDNWTRGVPNPETQVYIPAATSSLLWTNGEPMLSRTSYAGSVEIENGGSLNLNGDTLAVSGGVVDGHDNGTIRNGLVTLANGDGAQLRGTMPDVECTSGFHQLGGLTKTTGSFTVGGSCGFELAGFGLDVGKDFATRDGGLLQMDQNGAEMVVGGTTTFAGADESGWLSNGLIVSLGNFVQSGTNSFVGSGTGKVNIGVGGSTNQSITFADPINSYFQDLSIVLAPGKTVTVPTRMRIVDGGHLVVSGTGGTLALQQGLANVKNGEVNVIGTGAITVDLHGVVNTSLLRFGGPAITLTGDGTLDLSDGQLLLTDGMTLTVNISGTFIGGPPARGCIRGSNVTITGSNTAAVAALNSLCLAP